MTDVYEADGVDRAAGDEAHEQFVGSAIFLAFDRRDEGHGAVGKGDELAVEQVGGDRIGERDLAGGEFDGEQVGHKGFDGLESVDGIGEGVLMVEQDMAMPDRNDIIVECAGIDGVGVLFDE